MNKRLKKTVPTVLLYAALVIIAVIALFPLFYIVMASFRTDEEIFRYALPFSLHTLIPVDWTLENYKIIFTQFQFWRPILKYLPCGGHRGAAEPADRLGGGIRLRVF